MELKLTQIGNSVGIVLPKEVLAKLNLIKGDSVWMTEKSDSEISLSPYNADFAEQMKIARALMKKRRHVLRELAK